MNDAYPPVVTVSSAAFDVAPGVFDPDGDPVIVTPRAPDGGGASPASALFTGTESALFHFVEPGASWIPLSFASTPKSFLVATDGAASAQAAVSPTVDCR